MIFRFYLKLIFTSEAITDGKVKPVKVFLIELVNCAKSSDLRLNLISDFHDIFRFPRQCIIFVSYDRTRYCEKFEYVRN